MINVASIPRLEVGVIGKTGLRIRAQIQIQGNFACHLVPHQKILFAVAVPVRYAGYGVTGTKGARAERCPSVIDGHRRTELNRFRQNGWDQAICQTARQNDRNPKK
jgi:hypothetical protein